MTVEEAAAELKLAPFTVRQKCNKGKIAPAYKAGRSWVIEPSAIPAYRNRQRAQGANAPTRALIKKGLLQ
ncbi:helix-turn-helix domain-containing protein [Terrimicrobium sacchariphilum]|uniref:Helix-turn-helix domain-containing protein n=1 Tax=Terrimicrobium sacchariphilum TaxID=690879 RepID=A0A146GER0_TERSA|nr:helix-turn-helix domain-containing protein [Terrimicrobium sacchariphilum]GAT35593.1 helix-turn-helix domain-containing protein [Terrimicrobium sacchariphilum]